MGLEELVARLERDADARVASIEEACRSEVAAIESDRECAASLRTTGELAKRRSERRVRLDREASAARREARRAVLEAQRAVVERVLERAAKLLEDAHRDEVYRSTLASRLASALAYVRGRATIRCRPELVDPLRGALAGNEDVSILEDAAVRDGFRVESGAMEIDETLAARLRAMRDTLAIDLLKEISGER